MSEKRKTSINIMGIDYQVITDNSPDKVETIVEFVNNTMKETKNSMPYMTTMSAAVLTSLNLSEQLYSIKEELEKAKLIVNQEDPVSEEYKEKLQLALNELETYETKQKMLNSKIDRLESENEELTEDLNDYKQKYNALRTEYELNKRSLVDMQNKLLENQIELVKARKSLLDIND